MRVWIAGLALLAAAGCKKSSDSTGDSSGAQPGAGSGPEPAVTWYRAVLADDKGNAIPFVLEVPRPKSGKKAAAHSPGGRIELGTEWKGDTLRLSFGVFDTVVEATRAPDRSLSGTWTKRSPKWVAASLDFSAAPIASPDVSLVALDGEPPPDSEILGTWKLLLVDSGPAELTLTGSSDDLVGTIAFRTGNRIKLEGAAGGRELKLLGFDGSSPYLLEAKLAGGKLEGRWIAGAGLAWNEAFGGKKRDFDLETRVSIADTSKLDYDQIGAGDYRGKPLIVEIAGAWCVTCERAAPFLLELYREYHDRGLEILTLTYEFTDDSAYNQARARDFKEQYQLPWEVRAVDGDLESYWKIIPEVLTDVNPAGFPVALFVKPSGEVIGVHAGFPFEGSERYKKVTGEYRERVGELLQEP